MKIYLDYIFFENLIINALIIFQISVFTKTKTTFFKTLIASAIGAIYVVLITVYGNSFANNLLFRILVINIIVYVAFLPKKLLKYLKLQVYFYIIFFCYIGAIVVLTTFFKLNLSSIWTKISIYTLSYAVTYFSNMKMWKMWKNRVKEDDLIYEIKIKVNSVVNKIISFNAFVDTGNSLKDNINNTDILIVEEDVLKDVLKGSIKVKRIVKIPMNTVNGVCELNGYLFENVSIEKKGKIIRTLKTATIVVIDKKLSKDNSYSALMSYDTYIDKLQGVTL